MEPVTFSVTEQEFRVGVRGEAQTNVDGTSRQALVAKLRPGEVVHLRREEPIG